MAEKRSIYQFPTGTPEATTALLCDSADTSAASGYTTEKLLLSDLGAFLNGGLNYTQQLNTEAKNLFGAINELLTYCHNIAPAYDDTASYDTGDYCLYSGSLYKCVGATSGDFNPDNWVLTYITDEIGG